MTKSVAAIGPTSKDIHPCDVLLINPPWVSKTHNIRSGMKHAMPPLSILSIAAYIRTSGYSVQILDIHVERLLGHETREAIRRANPKWVGITVLTATSVPAHKIARIAKEACPGCRVVFGGVHAEAVQEETLANSAVDFVVRGDGEEIFLELIGSQEPESVRGVSYSNGTSIVQNPPNDIVMDLDKYPRPAYDLIPMHLYYPAIGAYKRIPGINMMMTRGCPGKCTFCNSANTTLRTRSASSVVEDIRYLHHTYGIREVEFFDDTFTIMVKNVKEFCWLMKEEKLDIVWTAYIRADCFNEEMGRNMKEAGCHQVLLGVESGNRKVLEFLRKPIALKRIKETVRIAQKCGLDVRASFILGNVGETPESMEDSFQYALELDAELVNFHINTPYPGTQLFKWAKEKKSLVSDEWSEYELSTILLKLPTVTSSQVFSFYERSHSRYFLRWSAIKCRLKRIRSGALFFDAFKAFFYVMLRLKPYKATAFPQCWSQNSKSDFFDLSIDLKNVGTNLTWEIRQGITECERDLTLLENYKLPITT
ncbi:MAG: radical SAM protein [Nitrospinota bacterium]|nr:radical SAM protein [Nitrospinota bacterium]